MEIVAKQHRVKNMGGVYTPFSIVQKMLDYLAFNGTDILSKHIMENSCGDGAFLSEIVRRYCDAFVSIANNDLSRLKHDLETYIHGIELDKTECTKCIKRLDTIALQYGIQNVVWDVMNEDALTVNKYDNKMDFVVGNPPYVRVHNLEDYDLAKKFSFAQEGMIDLYLVFIELGLKQLNKSGKMCLITPSSFMTSKSGKNCRACINKNKKLSMVVDLGQEQVFDGISAYTAITLFDNGLTHNEIRYVEHSTQDSFNLPYDTVFKHGTMSFDDEDTLGLLSDIDSFYKDQVKRSIVVKNGFATLADTCFMQDFESSEKIYIDVVKASTGKWTKCLFPYVFPGVPMEEAFIKQNFMSAYTHLQSFKDKLEKRAIDSAGHWYLFGRSQGIKDVFKNKVSINTLIKDESSIKLINVPAGSGVYSGLYILSDYSFDDIKRVIYDPKFIKYVKALKKYKSGGYFTFSSLELEKYLTYMLKGDTQDAKRQLRLFG